MRRTTRLRKLRIATCVHLRRLRGDVASLASATTVRELETTMSYVTIQLLNLWANFVRAYFLSCMLGARRESGPRIAVMHPGLTYHNALGIAVHVFRPAAMPMGGGRWDRRDEPRWHETRWILTLAANETFSNVGDIHAALSTGTRVFIDLPVFRNYFAHRNEQTRVAACNLALLNSIPMNPRPSRILLTRPLGRPQSLIEDWIDEVAFTVEYMCH